MYSMEPTKFLCRTCGEHKLANAMGHSGKSKTGITSLCKECTSLKNAKYYQKEKTEGIGHCKPGYNYAKCDNDKRDVHEMEHPSKYKIVVFSMVELIKYHIGISTPNLNTTLYFYQFGLDYPDCTKNGVTQEGARREILGISEVFKINNIKTKLVALETDQKVIEHWGKIENNIDIINGSWEFANTLLEKKEHLFIYANTFGKDDDIKCFDNWKALNPEMLVLLRSLRKVKNNIYNINLIKIFNNYNIYYMIISARGHICMHLMILIRKDIKINLPSKTDGENIFNLNDEYFDI